MMACANAEGDIFEHPSLEMVGWDGAFWRPLSEDEIVPLPEGSDLFFLPNRRPAGLDREADEVIVCEDPELFAVSAFIAPAYLRMLLPAYETLLDAPGLPLYAYSAVGIRDGEFVTSALRVDPDIRQDPFRFDLDEVEDGVSALTAQYPESRLVEHLTRCALQYGCRAAQNYFLGRFEAPLPAAPTCNALCVGCISFQPEAGDEAYSAAHDRIGFAPTPEELAEVACGHIARVGADAVVSFGQGCEGEPLMQSAHLEGAIRSIREQTSEGIVNLNSNASRPVAVRRLIEVGLNSLRISTNSARADVYHAYYRPTGYTFTDVRDSARAARDGGCYLMLNYFVFPGVTDTEPEFEALCRWIEEDGIQMIQLRNLNIDPEVYLETVESVVGKFEPMGLRAWLDKLSARFPALRFGYFNPPRGRIDVDSPRSPVI